MQRRLVTAPITDEFSIEAPCKLVETFSTLPRWRPKQVNKAADVTVGMPRDAGVAGTVLNPTLYLSIPYRAQVQVSGRTTNVLGNIAWRTELDLINIAEKKAVLGVVNAEILPFDWTAATRRRAATVASYPKAAGNPFELGPARQAGRDLARSLRRFRRVVEEGNVTRDHTNTDITGLARIPAPINSTHEPRFRHDPAVPISSLMLSVVTVPKALKGVFTTRFKRGQNRVVAR